MIGQRIPRLNEMRRNYMRFLISSFFYELQNDSTAALS